MNKLQCTLPSIQGDVDGAVTAGLPFETQILERYPRRESC